MIHPEFLGEDGEPPAEDQAVSLEGTASMWVLAAVMRASVHRLISLACRRSIKSYDAELYCRACSCKAPGRPLTFTICF